MLEAGSEFSENVKVMDDIDDRRSLEDAILKADESTKMAAPQHQEELSLEEALNDELL